MNRKQKVDSLYESVKGISDPDTFQIVIKAEPDDYVLADLRDLFWDGNGEKPWQVKEINRLLTRRKENRVTRNAGTPSGQEGEHKDVQVAKITARQAIVVALITALAGVAGGFFARPTSEKSVSAIQHRLQITRVENRSGLPRSAVRVIAEVNGQGYSYPSRALWAEISPSMSKEQFVLPVGAKEYSIRFEVLLDRGEAQIARFVSQEVHTVPITAIPISREYALFGVGIGLTRSGTSELVVHYEVH